MRIRYTTYDVRRKEDIINPRTSHRDILVLANNEDASDHPFLYARVIGIFHANVIYTGSVDGVINYRQNKLHFLWVRWFELDPKAVQGGWGSSMLDKVAFPPVEGDNAFNFLDPADVLRGCHIIPSFRSMQQYPDGIGLSERANDSNDWHSYYVNWQVVVVLLFLYMALTDRISAIS